MALYQGWTPSETVSPITDAMIENGYRRHCAKLFIHLAAISSVDELADVLQGLATMDTWEERYRFLSYLAGVRGMELLENWCEAMQDVDRLADDQSPDTAAAMKIEEQEREIVSRIHIGDTIFLEQPHIIEHHPGWAIYIVSTRKIK
jgi:hypothetical protein